MEQSLPPFTTKMKWKPSGPTNIGGRLTCIVCDPQHPDRIWVGAAGGGVWFSANAGRNWSPQWHKQQDSLNVGALAIDPNDPQHLYCGTGEANLSADSYPGVGLYETRDGGTNWSLIASASGPHALPGRIGAIAVDPSDSKHVLVGGIGFGEVAQDNDCGGMYVSRDGGNTWQREVFVSPTNYWCHSILFDPHHKGTVYATFTARGAASGIYRSPDGITWVQLHNGLPEPERFGRTSLALSLSSPDVVYALVADAR
jgi:photosystem II stability/assembly factor-like uncharacterized protein